MIRLQLRLIIAVAFVALLAISTGTVLAGPSMQAPGVTLSRTTLTVTEGGLNASYTVVLNAEPLNHPFQSVVVITPTLSTTTDVNIRSFSRLVFRTNNWNTAQTVTVRAIDDDIFNEGIETYTITHEIIADVTEATNYPDTLTLDSVTVTVGQ